MEHAYMVNGGLLYSWDMSWIIRNIKVSVLWSLQEKQFNAKNGMDKC